VTDFKTAVNNYLTSNGFGTFSPKAVLFDMDGVLIDSMSNHSVAWSKSMARYGINMQPAEAYKYEGMRSVEIVTLKAKEQWGRDIPEEEARSMYDTKIEEFAKLPTPPIMPGVLDLMRQIQDQGLLITVVTGSAQKGLLHRLETDFEGFVKKERIVSAYDVTKGKPQPDPYLAGLRKSGNLNPWEAIVVENAPLGVKAGHAARIFTVAVNTGPLDDSILYDNGADIVLPSMPEFSKQWKNLICLKS